MVATGGEAGEDREIVETLRALGVEESLIEGAMARGDPIAAVFEQVLSPEVAERTVSAEEIERRGGISVQETASLLAAFGIPVPDAGAPMFNEAEAQALVELGKLSGVYPREASVQVARVYGRLLARIAQTEVQLFRIFVEPRLRAEHEDAQLAVSAIRDAFARLLPLSDPLLVGVHRRWVEHQVAQVAVSEAETGAQAPLPGSVDVAFLFCDLKDFTAFVDREGDEAGADAIDCFADVVVRERGARFRFTKSLGDGMMLAYADTADAVEAGARIIAAMPDGDLPRVHASVHRGAAIAREGDYFGASVNLAARVLALAGPGELLVTRVVSEECGEPYGWERAGAIRVRGVAGLVEVFRLLR